MHLGLWSGGRATEDLEGCQDEMHVLRIQEGNEFWGAGSGISWTGYLCPPNVDVDTLTPQVLCEEGAFGS